jgi:parvulin-like peptidyl-prolyl isomerase
MMKKLLLVVLILLFAASCKWGKDNYVIKIGEVKVTPEEVQAEMDTIAPFSKPNYEGTAGTARFVDELAEKEILYLEARKRGLEKDAEYIKRLEAAQQETKKMGIKKTAGVQPWQRSLLVTFFMEKQMGSVPQVAEKEIEDYFNTHKYQVRISQIVAANFPAASEIFQRLKKGEDFAKVAKEDSLDKESAKAGGDLGYFALFEGGKLDPMLERILPILKKGDVGGPVTLPDGIHIIKATDIRPASAKFDEVKTNISMKLNLERRKEAYDKLKTGLKAIYKVEINKEALAKLPPVKITLSPDHP